MKAEKGNLISSVKGIGPKTEQLFHKLGVYTTNDLLRYYPRTYERFEEPRSIKDAVEGELLSVAAYVRKRPEVNVSSPLKVVTLLLEEDGSTLKLIWFRMPFLRSKLVPGSYFIYRGRVVSKRGALVMEQPKIYTPAEYERLKGVLQPVYPLTSGITSNMIGKAVREILKSHTVCEDYMPAFIRERYGLFRYRDSVEAIHFPPSEEELVFARKRLVFDEFLLFILALQQLRENTVAIENHYVMKPSGCAEQLLSQLPYELTGAQKRVWQEIGEDLGGKKVMSRLVQGDVGSGKTILAVLALLTVVENGYQGALMVPTEVLARQHYEDIMRMKEQYHLPIHPVLLTGSMKAKQKRDVYDRIACKAADIIIGTHALIQDRVEYSALALVVTDEQHRFGVRQREALSKKGLEPHVIVMSATPIPRTLAIILYGDLDISVVDELPAQRLPIKNCVVDTSFREKAYHFMEREIAKGRQVYIICPMVEESESLEAENVLDYSENLKSELRTDVRIECLHGRMKQEQKDAVMDRFARNEIQILVSTTVIEVGVNIPNATVIMIENAERFGLAQLHQLRGRVGRGDCQSYCIFVNGSKDSKNQKRLEVLNQSNDGFYIAAEDLKLRGPGDFFGIRQSGILDFQLADVYQDAGILKDAQDAAKELAGLLALRDENEELAGLKSLLEEYITSAAGGKLVV